MKFNVEIEIDWIDEENNLDGEIQDRIISSLTDRIGAEFEKGISSDMAKAAHALVKAKTELLINTVMEKPVVISDGWQSKKEYDSIFDMVESRMTALYEGKLDATGKCEKDPLLASIQNYTDQAVKKLLMDVEKTIKHNADIAAKKAVEESKLIQAIGVAVGQ